MTTVTSKHKRTTTGNLSA
uniref:Uncharacterized protein n=1 Tax=Anguilla anguilla TaxID=7936 RepID=A0A0E9XLA0_ANGAN